VKPGNDRSDWNLDARLANFEVTQNAKHLKLKDPAELAVKLVREGMAFRVETFRAKTSFLDLTASGDLTKGIALTGNVDLEALHQQLGDLVDLNGVTIAGKGSLKGSYRRVQAGYAGQTSLDLDRFVLTRAGAKPISLDQPKLMITGSGSTSEFGLPNSLVEAQFELAAQDALIKASLKPQAKQSIVLVSASVPISLSDKSVKLEGTLEGVWTRDSQLLDINHFVLSGAGLAKDLIPHRIDCEARGQLDLSKGTLVLVPFKPPVPDAPVQLGSEGIKVAGIGQSLDALKVDGSWLGDLAAIDRVVADWNESTPRGLAGNWSGGVHVEPVKNGLAVTTGLAFKDLSWPGPGETRKTTNTPVSFDTKSVYRSDLQQLQIADALIQTPFAAIRASGLVDMRATEKSVDLKGMLLPEWSAISTLMAERVEPGAKIAGEPCPFAFKAVLGDGSKPTQYTGDFVIKLTEADLFGMQLSAASFGAHYQGDQIKLDPIDSTLNGGVLHLVPRVVFDPKDGDRIVLEQGSSLKDAVVNDVVSQRVLSFVAPPLNQATKAHGKVSFRLDRAEFPLVKDVGRRALIEGAVVFEDVEFVPGPLWRQIISTLSNREPENLKLDDPVLLSISEGRIHEKGLAIPLFRNVTRLEAEGWVDFDKNMNMVVSLPFTPAMFGNNPTLSTIVAGTKIRVPLKGTITKPELDKQAFGASMKDMGRDVLSRTLGGGAAELIMQLAKPKPVDPNAPPPLTAKERKAQQLQKRNERRAARGLLPLPMPD
jgi:translocation and assembly module TamB